MCLVKAHTRSLVTHPPQAGVQEVLFPGNQHDGGHEEFVLRSVGGLGFPVPEEVEATLPAQAQTLQHVLEAGFEGGGAPAPVREVNAHGGAGAGAAPVPPRESSVLVFLREQIGARIATEEAAERARLEAMTGLSRYVASDWRRGNVKELFLANVADASGRASAEVSFAQQALLTSGDYAGFLQFRDNLGQGTFGRVDEITRSDFPQQGPLAMKTINQVNNRSQSPTVPVFGFGDRRAMFAREVVRGMPHPPPP